MNEEGEQTPLNETVQPLVEEEKEEKMQLRRRSRRKVSELFEFLFMIYSIF